MVMHRDLFKDLFHHSSCVLTAAPLGDLLQPSNFSQSGSNRFSKEQCALAFWRDFLINVEEGGIYLYALHIEVFNAYCYQKFKCVCFYLLRLISYKT